ncbi:DUF4867 family protein [Caproiciproducens galactitolivorans]|uniref:DUF4867 domain-containing protein n=1 Tax=Caproiciproducens galactitolivorans TaxID=642589 RepID=A0A4Z0YDJ5_9FIRM|nr:DUF4867 family protein [Caproiciproducens galactitolivorans]QEY35274.1 DUF4867 family protein [Caproiciproducens galactitolivorans]TGJ76970.1 hypothetical protein CAGA_10430 [Caproiciproducens galactitolivorans]
MTIYPVQSERFFQYGQILKGYDCSELLQKMADTPLPENHTIYVPSDPELEKLKIFRDFENRGFGGLPLQMGYCNGSNVKLNAVEYHRTSEINIAVSDLILLAGSRNDLDSKTYTYDTSLIEAFRVPAGCVFEIYAGTLHYAPCNAEEGGFRNVVVLPKGTNLPLETRTAREFEDQLLFAKNKWLVAHPESGLEKEGAYVGLKGWNITVS